MIVVAIIGLPAALAIPNFIKFQAGSSAVRGSVRTSRAIFTAEKFYYGDKQIYIDLLDVIGFAPERNNRYGYYAGGTAADVESRTTALTVPTAGPGVNCPAMNDGVAYIAADAFKYGAAADLGVPVAKTMLLAASGTA